MYSIKLLNAGNSFYIETIKKIRNVKKIWPILILQKFILHALLSYSQLNFQSRMKSKIIFQRKQQNRFHQLKKYIRAIWSKKKFSLIN